MKAIVVNILFTLLVLILFLLIGEATIRCIYRYIPDYNYEMWRYASELKKPLTGALPFHHNPDTHGRFYGVDIQINSLGMRDVERSIPKLAGNKRIVLLGDSFTLGWGVPFDSTFHRLLEKKINYVSNNVEVINMGVGNYNSTMEVELFKSKGLVLQPDLVVLMYYINDVEPTPKINNYKYCMGKYSYLFGLVGTKFKQLAMMHNSKDWLSEYYRSIYSSDSGGVLENAKSIRELIQICKKRNIKILIVNIPDLRRLNNYPFGFATNYISGLANESNIPFLDLLPLFDKFDAKSLWVSQEDSHMNSLANTLAADVIYNKIIDERILNIQR